MNSIYNFTSFLQGSKGEQGIKGDRGFHGPVGIKVKS